jgi:hypothetical protein
MKMLNACKSVTLTLALVLSAATGCSNEDEAKCNDTITNWCTKVASCGQTSKDSCITNLKKEIKCDGVVEVPSDHDKCAGQIEALTCPLKDSSFPNSCNIKTKG